MSKASIIAGILVATIGVIVAVNVPGVTEGFRYFLVMAGIVAGAAAALLVQEEFSVSR